MATTAPSKVRRRLERTWRDLEFTVNNARVPALSRRLTEAGSSSSRPVTGDANAVVSLTTYGERFATVHLTIESIADGEVRPSRLILWVDDPDLREHPTPQLVALVARGLEIRPTEDYRSHKKYYPALQLLDEFGEVPLVTADDDIIYPSSWLRKLVDSYARDPRSIHCYRARRITSADGKKLDPYRGWRMAWSRSADFAHFVTGVSGAIYPPAMLKALRAAGDGFLRTAPRADDVWLNYIAVRTGFPVRQIGTFPRHFPMLPDTQSQGLLASNLLEDGNDAQIAATYDAAAIARVTGREPGPEAAARR